MLDRIEFEYDGHRYRAESASSNISASGPARASNAQWYVSVDGEPEDIAFVAEPDDTEADLKIRILDWHRAQPRG